MSLVAIVGKADLFSPSLVLDVSTKCEREVRVGIALRLVSVTTIYASLQRRVNLNFYKLEPKLHQLLPAGYWRC
jgi:hypothetical protein